MVVSIIPKQEWLKIIFAIKEKEAMRKKEVAEKKRKELFIFTELFYDVCMIKINALLEKGKTNIEFGLTDTPANIKIVPILIEEVLLDIAKAEYSAYITFYFPDGSNTIRSILSKSETICIGRSNNNSFDIYISITLYYL